MSSVPGHSFRHFVEHELGKFPHFVIYAVLEWTLIALLFLDGFIALVSTEFAEMFDLPAPCVLCTRIDHMLARKKVRCCYNNSICEEHKKEVSSLAYCHVHGKLSDLRTMCEGCLLSFGTDNRSDPDAYKSMNGILHTEIDGIFDEEMGGNPNGKDDHHIMIQGEPTNGSRMLCSCCGEPMKVKSSGYQNNNNNIISNPPIVARVASRLSQQGPTPSPRAPFGTWRTEETRGTLDMAQIRGVEAKMSSNNLTEEEDIVDPAVKEDIKATPLPLSTEPQEVIDDIVRTPSFIKGNRFFGISISDNAAASPRWESRLGGDSVSASPRWASRLGGDSVTASPRWASRLGDSAVGSPKWAHRGSKKSLLDRVELAPDPVDQITGDETDTEAILIRLKKQVRQDRTSLIALYMELDEERSASAVAANNAMAMITRVQAEKASVQMESLQYQRMMEEQAEYDQEALEMLREMLNKREDEITELETELNIYRERYGIIADDIYEHRLQKSLSFSSFTEKSDNDHESPHFNNDASYNEMEMHEHMSDRLSNHNNNNEDDDESVMCIERERSYLFGQLRMLESRILHSSADSGVNSPSNGEQKGEEEKGNVLAKEVSELGEKLRSLEEDSRFLKNAIRTLKKDRTEGSKVLIEIAHNLQKLRHVDSSTSHAAVAVAS